MKISLLVLLAFSLNAFALEVDEKLTVRVLRTSETRKTLMVNRGTEDGLVEGDHAKFIVTAGIVARAVCIKVSPTRSVWSVYRLVNADFVVNDAVMTLKISPAVKITKDESQALVQEDTPTRVGSGDPTQLGIPLADGAQDIPAAGEDAVSQSDLKALEDSEPTTIVEKNIELFGILNISGLTSSTKTDTGGKSFNNSQASHHIGIGGEFYPRRERDWYSKFSLQAMANIIRADSQAYNGASTSNDVTEVTIGLNWHPTKLPSQTMTFIPYLHVAAGMGRSKSTYKSGSESAGIDVESSSNANTTSFAGGFGYKFYTASGFGFRALLDYYLRSEDYKADDATDKFNKRVGGPRFMLGLNYRF